MQHGPKLNRRTFLTLTAGALALGTAGCVGIPATPGTEPAQPAVSADNIDAVTESDSALVEGMAQSATRFLDILNEEERSLATYAFEDEERYRWHWTTPGRFPRNGLSLGVMDQTAKNAALELLESSLSPEGFEKALGIMSLQQALGSDPERYFFTLFGTPGGTDSWGWRVEGHHLSHHFTVAADRVVVTPFFLGAWPTKTDDGLRPMARRRRRGA